MTLLISPHPHQHLVLSDVLPLANPMDMKYLIVVFTCISLIASQAEHLIYLLVIYVFSVNCELNSFFFFKQLEL